MQRRRVLRTAVAALTAIVAGCRRGETTDAEPAVGNDGTPTPSVSPSSPPEESDQEVRVAPDGSFSFSPDSFEVATGDTVVWVWDGGGHNVRVGSAPDDSDWSGTPGDEGDLFGEGYTYSYTFTTAGEFGYYCAPHRNFGMNGSFTVTE